MKPSSSGAGFTLIEVIVAMVLLLVAVVSLVAASQIVATSGHRTAVELRATQLIQDETERLQTIPIGDVVDGARDRPGGSASWIVSDSGSYLRIDLAITTTSSGGLVVHDTVFVYRSK